MFCNTFAVVLVVVVSVTAIEATKSCPGFTLGEECFYVKLIPLKLMNYDSAKKVCSADGGHPANIHDRDQYNDIMSYLRTKTSNSIQVWLGMTYDPQNNNIRLYNGTVSEFVDWRPIYPVRKEELPNWTQMVVYARDKPSFTEGMGNIAPTTKLRGVLCESPAI